MTTKKEEASRKSKAAGTHRKQEPDLKFFFRKCTTNYCGDGYPAHSVPTEPVPKNDSGSILARV